MSMNYMFNTCMCLSYIIHMSMRLIEIDLPWIAHVIMHLTDDDFMYAAALDMLIT